MVTERKAMQLSMRSMTALAHVISGDKVERLHKSVAPYRSGPKLVTFFNDFGAEDRYGQGFPSRFPFTKSKLAHFNGTVEMRGIIEASFDPFYFEDDEKHIQEAVDYFNHYLKHDGFEVAEHRGKFKVQKSGDKLVELDTVATAAPGVSHEFIDEQVTKCRKKLLEEDYDGAITNARSLIEAVIFDIEEKLTGERGKTDGDLLKDYKRLQKLLNLEPSREDISNSLRQVLTGLTSIVGGLAPLRNRMSDAHARSYKPGRHHAKLVVNAAQTVADFLFETFAFQSDNGSIDVKSIVTKKGEAK